MSDIDAEEETHDVNRNDSGKIDTKRIFINHVDSFNGRNLAKVIAYFLKPFKSLPGWHCFVCVCVFFF